MTTREHSGFSLTGPLALGSPSELTISSGAITVTTSYHRVDTEGDAASDNLDTINGGVAGMLLVVRTAHDDRDVQILHGTGNILLDGSTDRTLTVTGMTFHCIYDSILGKWLELPRKT